MRRSEPLRLAVFFAALLASACGNGEPKSEGPPPIKIGAIFDLTGATSDVGGIYADGIRGYVDWTNQQGGIEGRPLDLLYQDYGYKVDQAEQLYTRFVQEGAVAFMGWGTGDTEALRGRIADDKIPFMSASYSHVLGDPKEAPYNFLVGTTYSDQLFILLDWILEQHEGGTPPRVALMHHPSPFGLSPYEQGGREYAQSRGIRLTAHEMPRGSTDYTSELTNITEKEADYIVFQDTSGRAALALKNAQSLGLEVDFLCLNWCTNGVLIDLAGDAAEGVVGSMLFSPPSDDVTGLAGAEAYLQEQGTSLEEKGIVYGQGWLTMAVMAEGIRRVIEEGKEVTGENIKLALETLREYDTGGVTYPITFTPDDHRGSKGMRLFRVRDGEWQRLTGFRTADR